MYTKIKYFTTYGVVLILLIIYLGIMFAKPQADFGYQMYLIDDLLVEYPGKDGLKYDFHNIVNFSNEDVKPSDRCLGKGWGNRENGFTWSVGNESHIYFALKNVPLILNFFFGAVNSDFQVYVNDNLAGSSSDINDGVLSCKYSDDNNTDNKSLSYRYSESIAPGNTILDICFRIDNPIRPCDISDSADTRPLGFQLRNILIYEDSEFNQFYEEMTDNIFPFGIEYELGTEVYFGSELATQNSQRRGKGWANREKNFCWTDDYVSDIIFKLLPNQDVKKLTLDIDVGAIICDSYSICVNDCVVLDNITINEDIVSVTFPIDMTDNDILKISILLNSPKRPSEISDSDDSRLLGLQVKSIILKDAS